jgi:hypothetical protein
MTKQNSEQELLQDLRLLSLSTDSPISRQMIAEWLAEAGFTRHSQPDKDLTSNVPYREAFQRGAASRDMEIDEIRAHIERLRKDLNEAM